VTSPISTVASSFTIQTDETTLADALLVDRDVARATELVAALTAVDGALVLDRDLTLHGFGAEICAARKEGDLEMIEYGMHHAPLGKPAPTPIEELGMRHRSAARLCRDVPGTLAFVVSQDGGIRLFASVEGGVRQFIDLSTD
jgi:hypothetical protein